MSCGKDQSISDNIKTNILNTHPNTKFLKNMTRNLSGAAEVPPQRLLATHRNTLRAAVVVHSHRHLAVTLVV